MFQVRLAIGNFSTREQAEEFAKDIQSQSEEMAIIKDSVSVREV